MDYDRLLEIFKTRHTIRAIKPDPIPDELVEKICEAARWAPTGFNMQPLELLVVKDPELRKAIKTLVDDYKNNDFYPMEATREAWQGHPWTAETHGAHDLALGPVFIAFLGDTRRQVGLPMAARYSRQKGDSIFDSSLANCFMYAWLAAHSLGLAAFPISVLLLFPVSMDIAALLISSISLGSQIKPLTPSSTTSLRPPFDVPITGTSQLIASRADRPKLSLFEGSI